jgi:trimethylamine corrinoid protein
MSAADAIRAVSRVLTSTIRQESKGKMTISRIGKVVIGTVSGDIHDIGKNIVALLLEVNGFDTHDLGKDIDSMKFIERAAEVQADIIALSALMTTTKPAQKEVTDLLKEMKLREKYIALVGGAPTSNAWAEEIKADGWAETAEQAVRVAQRLIQER